MINIGNKFIHAENIEQRDDKPAYAIVNTRGGRKIGTIEWYRYWGRYVLIPLSDTVWDAGCMESIEKFIGNLKAR